MTRVVCIIQARMGSSRLPGKVMKLLSGRPVLWHVCERVARCDLVDDMVVATSTNACDDVIEKYSLQLGWSCFRGSEKDVLDRYHGAAVEHGADVVVRVTSDCPLVDPDEIGELVSRFDPAAMDYSSDIHPVRSSPVGLGCEVVAMVALCKAHLLARRAYDREHVTSFIYTHPDEFRLAGLGRDADRSDVRLTLDTQDDYERLCHIYDRCYRNGEIIAVTDAIRLATYRKSRSEVAAP
jgi:spore coat polysaccharide biosynthesis protein SpsF